MQQKSHTRIFIASFFVIAKTWDELKMPINVRLERTS